MSASQGTRLFKLASQINIGKDAIVEFLQAKGFTIENKPTTMLSEEMVEVVMDKFAREAKAAEKQREKLEKYHTARHPEKPEIGIEDIPIEAPNPIHQTVDNSDSAPISDTIQHTEHIQITEISSVEPVHTSNDKGHIVGSVIALDNSFDKKNNKVSNVKSFIPKKETASKVEALPQSIKEIVEDSPVSSNKEIETVNIVPNESVITPEPIQETKQDISSDSQIPVVVSDPIASEIEVAKQSDAKVESIVEATSDSESIDPSKKKKRRIMEIEYEAGAMPQLRGLTVVGKIDLTPPPKPTPHPNNRNRDDRPQQRRNDRPQQGGFNQDRRPAGTRPPGNDKKEGGFERRNPNDRPNRFQPTPNQHSIGERLKAKSQDVAIKVSGAITDDDTNIKTSKKPLKPNVAGTPGVKPPVAIDKKKKKKKSIRESISEEDVTRAIRETLAGMEDSTASFRTKLKAKKKLEREEKEQRRIDEIERESTILRLTEFVTTADLAALMGIPAAEIIVKCMALGLMVSINQRLDKDTLTLIADDYGFKIEFLDEQAAQEIEDIIDDEDTLVTRPPIVTIMGHVDHGKTSLLDFIRVANVVAGESGGITQHIGAYHVDLPNGRTIAFLDTPGHEAFTAMRARGAKVTDIVVLVVAADDNVMPQTIEAISHAQAASVPIVVALNKIDKVDANPDKVRQQLADRGVLVEEWGGKYQSAEISAKKGLNIDSLLEKILLEADILELKANPNRNSRGTVIEAHLDKGKGVLATVMVQKGTLKVGDAFVAGVYSGRVRAMFDERGNRVEQAGPSLPVQVSGFDGTPQAGDLFAVLDTEVEARAIATKRQQLKREQTFKQMRPITLDEISQDILRGGTKELKLIIKSDVSGSMEALSDSLQKLTRDEAKVTILHKGVGPISESDVMLAAASSAVVVGFHVSPTSSARKSAEAEGVDIRLYTIIYDCINEIQMALEGLLSPEIKEDIIGNAEVRQVFKISKVGAVAGSYVLSGKIHRNDRVRVMRDGFMVYNSTLSALKRFKDDVKEVDTNYECGISINGFNDFVEGDIIEAYKQTEVRRKLSQ